MTKSVITYNGKIIPIELMDTYTLEQWSWKDTFPDHLVSDYGRVYSLKENKLLSLNRKSYTRKVHKDGTENRINGYIRYLIKNNEGERVEISAQNICYMYFGKEPFDPEKQRHHINQIHDDNYIGNLQ